MATRAEFPASGSTDILDSELEEIGLEVIERIAPDSDGSSRVVVEEAWKRATARTIGAGDDSDVAPFGRTSPIDLVRLALEVDVLTPDIRAAIPQAIQEEGTGALLQLFSHAPRSSTVARRLGADIVEPEFVLSLLSDATTDAVRLAQAIRWADPATVAPPLLSALSGATGQIRDRVLNVLSQLRGGVGPALMERLADSTSRRSRSRDALRLAEDLAEVSPDFDELLDHPNPGYRLVGLARLFESPKLHDTALAHALADDDPDVRSRALDEVRERKIIGAVDRVVEIAGDPQMPTNLRTKAIGVLGRLRCEDGLEALADYALERNSKAPWTLQPISPETISAVKAILKGTWRHTSVARRVHDLASRSPEPDFRAVAESYVARK